MPDLSGMAQLRTCCLIKLPKMLELGGGVGAAPRLSSVMVQGCVGMRSLQPFVDRVAQRNGNDTPFTSLHIVDVALSQDLGGLHQLTALTSLVLHEVVVEPGTSDMGLNLCKMYTLMDLRRLEVDSTSLARFPRGICVLTRMHTLCLANSGLRRIPGEIQQLRHLTKLSLVSLSSLTVLPCIISLQSLQTVHLRRLELVRELNSSLWGLRRLLFLHLEDMPISLISDRIGELTQLLSLKLSNLCILDLPLGMAGLTALQNLSVTGCPMCTTSNGVLAHLKALDTFELRISPDGHQRVFAELAEAMAGLQALCSLEVEGLHDTDAQTAMRAALMQPPERLQDVHVNGFFFDFWRTGFLCNKGLAMYETPLTFAKIQQQRFLAFAAARWTRGMRAANELPTEVMRIIYSLASDGAPPQGAEPPQDEEVWV